MQSIVVNHRKEVPILRCESGLKRSWSIFEVLRYFYFSYPLVDKNIRRFIVGILEHDWLKHKRDVILRSQKCLHSDWYIYNLPKITEISKKKKRFSWCMLMFVFLSVPPTGVDIRTLFISIFLQLPFLETALYVHKNTSTMPLCLSPNVEWLNAVNYAFFEPYFSAFVLQMKIDWSGTNSV